MAYETTKQKKIKTVSLDILAILVLSLGPSKASEQPQNDPFSSFADKKINFECLSDNDKHKYLDATYGDGHVHLSLYSDNLRWKVIRNKPNDYSFRYMSDNDNNKCLNASYDNGNVCLLSENSGEYKGGIHWKVITKTDHHITRHLGEGASETTGHQNIIRRFGRAAYKITGGGLAISGGLLGIAGGILILAPEPFLTTAAGITLVNIAAGLGFTVAAPAVTVPAAVTAAGAVLCGGASVVNGSAALIGGTVDGTTALLDVGSAVADNIKKKITLPDEDIKEA